MSCSNFEYSFSHRQQTLRDCRTSEPSLIPERRQPLPLDPLALRFTLYRCRQRSVCLPYPRSFISRAASQGESHEYLNRRRPRADPGPAARSHDQERRVVPVSPGDADVLTGLHPAYTADNRRNYRIQRSLQVKLNEMGWADQVLSHAKGGRAADRLNGSEESSTDHLSHLLALLSETASTQNPLNFDSLQDNVQEFASSKPSGRNITVSFKLTLTADHGTLQTPFQRTSDKPS
jgi:hypothetical protein